MSFKLLKIGRARVLTRRIGRCAEETQSVSKRRFGNAEPKRCASIRAALVAATVCVATYLPSEASAIGISPERSEHCEAMSLEVCSMRSAPSPSQARSLIHYFDFDTPSGSGLAYTDVDKGTSPANFTLKGSSVPRTSGALDSDYAYYSSAATTASTASRGRT